MFCSNCGKRLKEGANFCDECGTSVQSAYNDKNFNSKKSKKCSFCGELLKEGALTCPSCGNQIEGSRDINERHTQNNQTSSDMNINHVETITYPDEAIETSRKLELKQREKLILKSDGFICNQSDEFEHELVLTNQALYIVQYDEDIKVNEVIRIPLSQINQCLYHRGGFFADKYLDIVTTQGIKRIDVVYGSVKKLALWELALNDRFKSETVQRDFDFYSKVNIKSLK